MANGLRLFLAMIGLATWGIVANESAPYLMAVGVWIAAVVQKREAL